MRFWLRVAAIVLMMGTVAHADTNDWDSFIDHGGPAPKNKTPQLAGTSQPAKTAPATAAPKREARATKAKTSKAKPKRTVKPTAKHTSKRR